MKATRKVVKVDTKLVLGENFRKVLENDNKGNAQSKGKVMADNIQREEIQSQIETFLAQRDRSMRGGFRHRELNNPFLEIKDNLGGDYLTQISPSRN